MVFVPFSLVALVAFATYVATAICWQRTRRVPAQAGRCATTPAQRASNDLASRLFTNR